MNWLNDGAALLGRLLLSINCILSGVQKLVGFSGTVELMGAEGLPVPMLAAIVAQLLLNAWAAFCSSSAIRRVQPGS
jgi:putative oxidoreductase